VRMRIILWTYGIKQTHKIGLPIRESDASVA
jgi:hypothetical protein